MLKRRRTWSAATLLAVLASPLIVALPVPAGANSRPAVTIVCSPEYEVLVAHSDGGLTDYPQYATSDGSCPNQVFYDSMFGSTLNRPIVGMAATPDGGGYWLVASDGGVFTFGDSHFFGSTGSIVLNKPIVGIASTPDGGGYWLVASDGGVFAFGDAHFFGSTGSIVLNKPIVGIATDGSTGGYWLAASDGGIFAFNAPFLGSMGATPLNAPITLMSSTPGFGGYRLIGSDGGVFDFGNAMFYGSAAVPGSSGWTALATNLTGDGYWLFANIARSSTCPVISSTPCGPPPTTTPNIIVQDFGNVSQLIQGSAGNISTAPIVGAATLSLG